MLASVLLEHMFNTQEYPVLCGLLVLVSLLWGEACSRLASAGYLQVLQLPSKVQKNLFREGVLSFKCSCECADYFSLYVGPSMSCQLLHFFIWRNLLKVSNFQNQEVRGESVGHTDTVNKFIQHQHVQESQNLLRTKQVNSRWTETLGLGTWPMCRQATSVSSPKVWEQTRKERQPRQDQLSITNCHLPFCPKSQYFRWGWGSRWPLLPFYNPTEWLC